MQFWTEIKNKGHMVIKMLSVYETLRGLQNCDVSVTFAFICQRKSGWRFRKRPGVDAFLNQLGPPLFEVVIYTHEAGFVSVSTKRI